jgi:hypothetical protein
MSPLRRRMPKVGERVELLSELEGGKPLADKAQVAILQIDDDVASWL